MQGGEVVARGDGEGCETHRISRMHVIKSKIRFLRLNSKSDFRVQDPTRERKDGFQYDSVFFGELPVWFQPPRNVSIIYAHHVKLVIFKLPREGHCDG
jgi:dipeptidyl aminopeptidase/acylaminoacyl peptidase